MTLFRRTFHKGKMQQDADNRFLPEGEYREAINAVILNSEGSDEGVVQKSLSNKRLTNLDFGPNPTTLGSYSHESRNRIYWVVLSDTGSFLVEWDHQSQTATFVLKDTRALGNRVFSLKKDHFCDIDIIPSDDPDKELMLLTDFNMPPLCFNIARAKTFTANSFDEEDIVLIKKPPRYAPTAQFSFTSGVENYLKDVFVSFSYRYKYRDGEYSALSTYTNYKFLPGKSELDFKTVENIGMLNNSNAINVGFNTGDERVTDIQLVVKKSNSKVLYIVETFNKEAEGWGDEETKTFLFANNKRYQALPEKELYRPYDNVPLKAVTQTVIGNRPVYGHYMEGYNLIDINQRKVKMDYSLSVISNSLAGSPVPYIANDPDHATVGAQSILIDLSTIQLKKGAKLSFSFEMKTVHYEAGEAIISGSFVKSFDYILNNDYANAEALYDDPEFKFFVNNRMTSVFNAESTLTPPADSELINTPIFGLNGSGNILTIFAPVFEYQIDETPGIPDDEDFSEVTYEWHFFDTTTITFSEFGVSSSVKTNRSYEVGVIYLDKYNRSSTALTAKNNTIYIPPSLSTSQNKIKATLNNLPPAFADRYKFVVKQNTLSYYTIYGVLFYKDGPYRWIRLDGANKDKVKEGDTLIVKADLSGPKTTVQTVRVIEVKLQEANFIPLNLNAENVDIPEVAGLYMKIASAELNMEETGQNYYEYSKLETDAVGTDAQIGIGTNEGSILAYPDFTTNQYVDIPIQAGTRIQIIIAVSYYFTPGIIDSFDQPFYAQATYPSFEAWFNAEWPGLGGQADDFTVEMIRLENNASVMLVTSLRTESFITLSGGIRIQLTEALVVFETQPLQIDEEIFYETEQTFDIADNYHTGTIQDQNAVLPAIIELDFFNCYAMGGGIESYRVKDALNDNFLNIDLRPTATSIEEYKQIIRQADLTYGEPYIESSSINGLNEFNLSTANYKELEKQFGSIQKIYARDNDIVILQEDKAGKVLFDKSALFTADGNSALTGMNNILGTYIPYFGSFGIGKRRESFSVDNYGRMKYASPKSGAMVRLSMDGVEVITSGLKNWFRNIFLTLPNARIITGYDPHSDQTVVAIGDEPVRLVQYGCKSQFIKSRQSEAFTYEFKLNNLGGDVIINYNITEGNATIIAEFNDTTHGITNVTGMGNLTFERDSLVENIITVTITPIGGPVSYTVGNSCPTGTSLTIVEVILNDDGDTGQNIVNRYRWNGSSFYESEDTFIAAPVTRFTESTGVEGVGAFPVNGSLMTMQSLKGSFNTGTFRIAECNRIGYLVSDIIYTAEDYMDILSNPDTEFLTLTESGEPGFSQIISGIPFVFNRTETDQRLYLIWDYTNRQPVVNDDSASVSVGGTTVIEVLTNDEISEGAIVIIPTQPVYGTAVVNEDNAIVYTHDGSDNFEDSFPYTVSVFGCSATANVYIGVGVPCSAEVIADGTVGIYRTILNIGTGTGFTGITYNSQGIPDRFRLIYNDEVVADSLYVGDSLVTSPEPVSYPGLLGTKTLPVFTYNGVSFDDTGEEETFDIVQGDIADNVTKPTNGNGTIFFVKSTELPTTIMIEAIGPIGSTVWDFQGLCPVEEKDTVDGDAVLIYGFYTESNKAQTTVSALFYRAVNTFYTNKFFGDDYAAFNFNAGGGSTYINDGTNWYQLDATGTIVTQGAL